LNLNPQKLDENKMNKPTNQMNNSTTQQDGTTNKEILKSIVRDFNIYARRYCPESRALVRRFQATKETKGTWGHIECVVHILKLEMTIIQEDSRLADRSLYHMCRDVTEWVYGTNKTFSGSPCASIIRDYIHRKLQQHKPFPKLHITHVLSDDSSSETEEDEREDSGIDAADTPTEDQDSQDDKDSVKDNVETHVKDNAEGNAKGIVKDSGKDIIQDNVEGKVKGNNEDITKDNTEDHIEDNTGNIVKDNAEDSVKGNVKDNSRDVKDIVKDTAKDYVKGHVKDKVKGNSRDVKDIVKDKAKDYVKGHVKDEVKGNSRDVKDTVKDKAKDYVKGKVKDEVKDKQVRQSSQEVQQASQSSKDVQQSRQTNQNSQQDLRSRLANRRARLSQQGDKQALQDPQDGTPRRDAQPTSPEQSNSQPTVKSVAVKINPQKKRRLSLAKRKSTTSANSPPAKRRMSPERGGWDEEIRRQWTPDTKKRKLAVTEDIGTKDPNVTPKAKIYAMEYKTFEMRWNETNDPDHWLDQLKEQGAYNRRCRCTLITREHRKHLVIQFPITEKRALSTFQKKKDELNFLNITSMDKLEAKKIPVQAHEKCFRFD
jgi:hypothetical protein